MIINFDPSSIESYREFLKVKSLPAYAIRGRVAEFPDEYAARVRSSVAVESEAYAAKPWMFDYQRDIVSTALRKRRFAIFADCGLGKTLMILDFAANALARKGGKVLILTPPLVVKQMIGESAKFYGESLPVRQVKAAELSEWIESAGDEIGITNYEALKDETPQGNLTGLILDESSILKSHYGKYGGICIRLGRGVEYKLCATGTPAPNDRIEYANHAVFLDRFPTVNAFLATYFINRGQTEERWELKPHALRPFYRSLSDWSIFLTNPAVYGWRDNVAALPPIHTHIHEVELTRQQKDWINKELGNLIATRAGGITKRASYGQVSKGFYKGDRFESRKPEFIASLIDSWKASESSLVWCLYDNEQDDNARIIEGSESMDGSTPMEKRQAMIDRFKARETHTLISKSQILGFGLNLQVATRQVFSGLQDSYEKYYQCVKRSNRIGSTQPLNVHIPVTELEYPMLETVLKKANRVEADTREQEAMFLESMR
jgi:hypothetical protein